MVVANVEPLPLFNLGSNVVSARSTYKHIKYKAIQNATQRDTQCDTQRDTYKEYIFH